MVFYYKIKTLDVTCVFSYTFLLVILFVGTGVVNRIFYPVLISGSPKGHGKKIVLTKFLTKFSEIPSVPTVIYILIVLP